MRERGGKEEEGEGFSVCGREREIQWKKDRNTLT